MACEERWEEALQAYLDEELDEQEQSALEEHLRSCQDCAAAFKEMYRVNHLLQKAFESLGSGSGLTARVIMELTQKADSRAAAPGTEPATPSRLEEEENLVGRTIAGYKIDSLIGRGGMGAVYKAEQVSMERPVALKVLPKALAKDEKYVMRFLREARAAGELNHPNIVRVYDVGREGDVYFFSMEYVEGKTAHQKVLEDGPMEPREALEVAAQVADALEHAHSKGIIHRDIKPDNIIIEPGGGIKLTDMGLAKRTTLPEDSVVTVEGQVMGTPNYMSPEQVTDSSSVDRRTDIYSLGMTLYFLLTGRKPFGDKKTAMEILVSVARDVVKFRREDESRVPRAVMRLVRRLTARDRAARPQTAQQALREIEQAIKFLGTVGPARRVQRPVVERERMVEKRRSSLPLMLGGAAVVALVVVIVAVLAGRPPKETSKRAGADRPTPAAKTPGRPVTPVRPVAPPTRPTPPQPTTQEPSIEEQVASEELEKAKKYESEHPKDYAGILGRYESVYNRYGKTEAALEARRCRASIVERLETGYTEVLNAAEALAGKRDFSGAMKKMQEFATVCPGTAIAARAVQKAQQFEERWKKRTQEALAAARNRLEEGEKEDALKALEELSGWASPLCKAEVDGLLGRVRGEIEKERRAEAIAQLERESLAFYRRLLSAVERMDLEKMRKAARQEKSPVLEKEMSAFCADVDFLERFCKTFVEEMKTRTASTTATMLMRVGERELVGRVTGGENGFVTVKSGSAIIDRSIADFEPAYVENIMMARLRGQREMFISTAFLYLAAGDLKRAHDRLLKVESGLDEAVETVCGARPGEPYDATAAVYHYARIWAGLSEPLEERRNRAELASLVDKIGGLLRRKEWRKALDGIEEAMSDKYEKVRDEKIEGELLAGKAQAETMLAQKRNPPAKVDDGDLLAALKKHLHAAGVRKVKKNVFEVKYDFRDKRQFMDWRFNGDRLSEERLNRMWRALEARRRRRMRRIPLELPRWSLLPYGKDTYIKIRDCTLRWDVAVEGDLSVEWTVLVVGAFNIGMRIYERDERWYAAVFGFDNDIRREIKGTMFGFLRVWREDRDRNGEPETQIALARSHQCYKKYQSLMEFSKVYRADLTVKGEKMVLRANRRTYATARDKTYRNGTLSFFCRGDERREGYWLTGVVIKFTPDPEWVREALKIGEQVSRREPEKPGPGRRVDDEEVEKDIEEYVEGTRRRIKGVTDEDADRLRTILREIYRRAEERAKQWGGGREALRWAKVAFDRVKSVEDLRREMERVEKLGGRQGPPPGNPPGPGPGRWGPGRWGPGRRFKHP